MFSTPESEDEDAPDMLGANADYDMLAQDGFGSCPLALDSFESFQSWPDSVFAIKVCLTASKTRRGSSIWTQLSSNASKTRWSKPCITRSWSSGARLKMLKMF